MSMFTANSPPVAPHSECHVSRDMLTNANVEEFGTTAEKNCAPNAGLQQTFVSTV